MSTQHKASFLAYVGVALLAGLVIFNAVTTGTIAVMRHPEEAARRFGHVAGGEISQPIQMLRGRAITPTPSHPTSQPAASHTQGAPASHTGPAAASTVPVVANPRGHAPRTPSTGRLPRAGARHVSPPPTRHRSEPTEPPVSLTSVVDEHPRGRTTRPAGAQPTGNVPTGNVPTGNVPTGNGPIDNAPIGRTPVGNEPTGHNPRRTVVVGNGPQIPDPVPSAPIVAVVFGSPSLPVTGQPGSVAEPPKRANPRKTAHGKDAGTRDCQGADVDVTDAHDMPHVTDVQGKHARGRHAEAANTHGRHRTQDYGRHAAEADAHIEHVIANPRRASSWASSN